MQRTKEEAQLWKTFSRTGKIGVYLLYRAVLAAEDKENYS